MDIITKVCTKCGKEKSLDEYWNHPSGRFGKRPRCKECIREENAEFEKTYRPARAEHNRQAYENHKGEIRIKKSRWVYKAENKRNHNLRTRYGISAKEYDDLLDKQDRKCAICGFEMDEGKRLAVDHDHLTGRIRGILHVRCNTAIALLKDSPDICRKAAEYLESSLA